VRTRDALISLLILGGMAHDPAKPEKQADPQEVHIPIPLDEDESFMRVARVRAGSCRNTDLD
jgi:hypothetical protein